MNESKQASSSLLLAISKESMVAFNSFTKMLSLDNWISWLDGSSISNAAICVSVASEAKFTNKTASRKRGMSKKIVSFAIK